MTDGSGDPWTGRTYKGFSGGGSASEAAPAQTPRRRGSRRLVGAGLALAIALGLSFGLVTRNDLGEEPPLPDRARPLEPTRAAVPIEVATVNPAPLPTEASAPLEVLPPDMARAAAARPVIRAPAPLAPAPQKVQVAESAIAAPASPAFGLVPDTAPTRTDPGFDCRYAGSRAERMVCGDAQLARLDRRLNRTFEQAIASGVPRGSLRQDQDDWLSIREDAARQAGPDAVASVYRQRIAELDDLAREASEPY